MSKRPCAITLTPDDSIILCGDKFGDVYSLPLLGMPYKDSPELPKAEIEDANGHSKKEFVSFVPAASSRTVHTKKNQEALRNQQRQVNRKKEMKAPSFEHQLLLGHVSLLTDLAYVSLENSDSPSGRPREYILTSDRDEHIRVSRGLRQAHIIEGYCQGHKEFVSKICIPQRNPQLLISGGGDGQLFVWNWLQGSVRQRFDLREPINRMREKYQPGPAERDHQEQGITVAGIWSLLDGHIVVICEGLAA